MIYYTLFVFYMYIGYANYRHFCQLAPQNFLGFLLYFMAWPIVWFLMVVWTIKELRINKK